MLFRPIRWAASALVSLVVLYAFFFVPLGGEKTLWEHARSIAGTPEARELGRDLDRAGHQVARRVRDEVVPSVVHALRDGGADASPEVDGAAP